MEIKSEKLEQRVAELEKQSTGSSLNFLIGVFILFGFGVSLMTGLYYGAPMIPTWIYKMAFDLIIISFLYDLFTNFKANNFAIYPFVIIFYISSTFMLILVENTLMAPYFKDIATTENFFDFMAYGFNHLATNSQDKNWILPWSICIWLLCVVTVPPFKIVFNFILTKFFTKKDAV